MAIRIVLLIILLVLRCFDLEVRPPHHDESVNGWFVDGVMSRGFYVYDPANYHGPLYFYVLALFEQIFGRSLTVLRIPTILLGWMVNLTPFLFRRWIGDRAAWIAVFFLAVSPAMVFFSRYAIHEMGFALSCILFFYYWLEAREGAWSKRTVIGLGLSLGAMACLKENFILYVVTLFIAEGCLKVYEKRLAINNGRAVAMGSLKSLAIASVLIVIFYSGFFQDLSGIPNFFKAFELWSQTGSNGNGHQKPFFYWIGLMGKLEWFSLLGLALVPLALKKVPKQLRLLSVSTFGMFLVYSIVAYKTPWCLLCFYWGFVLIAAYWLSSIMKQPSSRYVVSVLLIFGFCFSAYQSYDAAYENPDQENHLYIYGQTYRELMPPLNQVLDMAKKDPQLYERYRIQVLSTFTWPLPYIFGQFKMTAFYGENNAPMLFDGDLVLIDRSLEDKYASRLSGQYTRQEVRARQWAGPIVIFTKK